MAGGRFCAGGSPCSSLFADAGLFVDVAGSAVLWLGSESAAGVGAWIWVAAWGLGPWVHALA